MTNYLVKDHQLLKKVEIFMLSYGLCGNPQPKGPHPPRVPLSLKGPDRGSRRRRRRRH